MAVSRITTSFILTAALGVLCFGASSSQAASPKVVSLTINDAPIREAIEMLWVAGGPDGTSYVVDESVSRETRVSLSLVNAPFDVALDAVCRSAGLKYVVAGDAYRVSNDPERVAVMQITRLSPDRLSWRLRDADPMAAARQLLAAFAKKADIDVGNDPVGELEKLGERVAQELLQLSQVTPEEAQPRLKELRNDMEQYVKPPKRVNSGTRKSISVEDASITFADAMDTLGEAAGFLWFRRPDGRIVIRGTADVDQIKQIFTRCGVWQALQK